MQWATTCCLLDTTQLMASSEGKARCDPAMSAWQSVYAASTYVLQSCGVGRRWLVGMLSIEHF